MLDPGLWRVVLIVATFVFLVAFLIVLGYLGISSV